MKRTKPRPNMATVRALGRLQAAQEDREGGMDLRKMRQELRRLDAELVAVRARLDALEGGRQ